MMASLSTGKGVIQPVHIDDVLPEVVDRVECRNQGLEKSRALMTGIDELDAKRAVWSPETWYSLPPVLRWGKPNLRWTSSTR